MCIANLASLKEPVRWLVVYADKIIRSETDPATGEEGAANRLRETIKVTILEVRQADARNDP